MYKATSAGGVIIQFNQNNEPEVLLIRDISYNDWFLPKGHMEAGETVEETARREIQEETGLTELENKDYLGEFTRYAETANEIKTEEYFLFLTRGNINPVPEDAHKEIRWFTQDSLPTFYIPEQEKIVRDNWKKIEDLQT